MVLIHGSIFLQKERIRIELLPNEVGVKTDGASSVFSFSFSHGEILSRGERAR